VWTQSPSLARPRQSRRSRRCALLSPRAADRVARSGHDQLPQTVRESLMDRPSSGIIHPSARRNPGRKISGYPRSGRFRHLLRDRAVASSRSQRRLTPDPGSCRQGRPTAGRLAWVRCRWLVWYCPILAAATDDGNRPRAAPTRTSAAAQRVLHQRTEKAPRNPECCYQRPA
jgi:hypothetical protein